LKDVARQIADHHRAVFSLTVRCFSLIVLAAALPAFTAVCGRVFEEAGREEAVGSLVELAVVAVVGVDVLGDEHEDVVPRPDDLVSAPVEGHLDDELGRDLTRREEIAGQ
jgi:hypothetical protein